MFHFVPTEREEQHSHLDEKNVRYLGSEYMKKGFGFATTLEQAGCVYHRGQTPACSTVLTIVI